VLGRLAISVCFLLALTATDEVARALDKQGSGAHSGAVDGRENGFGVSGATAVGLSVWNPTYAARPDNSGHVLMRYALRSDIDLIGRRLSVPIDVNLFSDRDARGAARKLVPSELDIMFGLTSTWKAGAGGALEVGSRVEIDRPLDSGGYSDPSVGANAGVSQAYLDVRARYLYSLAPSMPGLGTALGDGDVSGWFTLGWFAVNPKDRGTYFARPNNTGRALLRYAWHGELSVYGDVVSFAVDTTFFTDRSTGSVLSPTELDLTPEIILRRRPWELHLAYERDMPLDSSNPFLVQQFFYLLAGYEFDMSGAQIGPLETREHIPSP
jgi:hypothetical protein